ncbi:hypothetical protein ABZ915_09625 [Streptomyces sp. NPDC046915]|uniref:hypothetical protein n=1 Tax=Streptomyces sp. NPDC046915 TaxID=3155257 RepID=UPI0033C613E4
MLKTRRSTAVTAGVVAATALVAGGLTYASAASGPVDQAPAVQKAEAMQEPALGTGTGGDPGGKGNEGNNNVSAFVGNIGGNSFQGKGREGRHEERRHEDEGRIDVNERSYSSRPGDCITVLLLGGANSLNIRNDSRRTVEVFNGVVCDNGAPIATVGPHSSSFGVIPTFPVPGLGVGAASFRVVRDNHDRDHDRDDDNDW